MKGRTLTQTQTVRLVTIRSPRFPTTERKREGNVTGSLVVLTAVNVTDAGDKE